MSEGEDKVELTADDLAVIASLNGEDEKEPENTKTGVSDDDSTDSGDTGGADEPEATEFTDEHRQQAQAYGLDLKQFETPEQLEKQILGIDHRWAEYAAMQRYLEAQAGARPGTQRQAPQQPVAPAQPQQQQQQPPEVPFKLDLDPNEYPPELVEKINGVLQQVHQHYQPLQQQVQQMQQFIAEQSQRAEAQQQQQVFNEFHAAVQTLGHKQLFGDTPETLTQNQAQNLRKLYDHASALAEGYVMRGIQVPPMSELVRRAERLAFEQELEQYRAQTRNARLTKQAKQRLGSGVRPGGIGQGDPYDGDIVNNPELIEAWKRYETERGER